MPLVSAFFPLLTPPASASHPPNLSILFSFQTIQFTFNSIQSLHPLLLFFPPTEPLTQGNQLSQPRALVIPLLFFSNFFYHLLISCPTTFIDCADLPLVFRLLKSYKRSTLLRSALHYICAAPHRTTVNRLHGLSTPSSLFFQRMLR